MPGEGQDKARIIRLPISSWLLAILLVAIGLLHAIRPKWLTLDWPSVALVIAGVVLFFLPITRWGELFQSVEFGKLKILFRDVQALAQSAEDAQTDQVLASKAALPKPAQSAPAPAGRRADQISPSPAPEALGQKSAGSESVDIASLLLRDKRLALLKIGSEIELKVGALARVAGFQVPARGFDWNSTVDALANAGRISASTADAILNFRNVRNQIVHPTGLAGEIPDSLTISAIDSGLKILNILSNA